jgi:hypothetical protein
MLELLMLPLTPRVCALCYDGDVYSVQNVNGWSSLKKIEDIARINEHQYLKCGSNIYFSDWNQLSHIANEFLDLSARRLAQTWELIMADHIGTDKMGEIYGVVPRDAVTKSRRSFMNLRATHPIPRSWPSVIRYRSNPSIFTNGSLIGFVRRSVVEAEAGMGPPYSKYKPR